MRLILGYANFLFYTLQVAGPVAVLATTAVSSAFVIVSLTTTYDANGTPSSILPLPFQWALCLLSPTALSIAIERVSVILPGHSTIGYVSFMTLPLD